MRHKCRRIAWVAGFVLAALPSFAQFYHGMHHPFGKNRVQYEQFDWQKFEFNDFTVFFYGEGRNLAVFTARNAGEMINEVERFFDYGIKRERLQFVVYEKLEHFRQSNVGIPETDESNIGGTTQIAGSKIFVYYNGDLNDLRRQIRKGISQVLIAQMLFGDNWREMIKNTTLLSFPEWYTEGLIGYAAEPWNVNVDDRLRDIVLRGKYKNFARLKGADARVAGQSLWYYIGETYGTNVIPNIIYMARVSRNVESGFLFVLGISLNTLLDDAHHYFLHRYEQDITGTQDPGEFLPVRTRARQDYSELKLSKDGRYLAYVSNDLSKTKVWIYDTETKKRKRYLRQGHRLDRIYDQSYPILDWNPVTGKLVVITEKQGRIWMHQIDPAEGKESKKEILRLEKVLEMDFSPDGKQMLFSAINKGQADIYLYSIAANSHKQLTSDIYDDRYPSFWGSDRVIFSSNRQNDTVDLATSYLEYSPAAFYDLYVLDLEEGEVAMKLTATPAANEVFGQELDRESFVYLGDQSGISNRYRGYVDSAIISIDTAITYRYFTETEPISGYPRNIIEFDYDKTSERYLELMYYEGKYRFKEFSKDSEFQYEPPNSNYRQLQETPQTEDVEKEITTDTSGIMLIREKVFEDGPVKSEAPPEEGLIDIRNYQFEEESITATEEESTAREEPVVSDSAAQAPQPEFVVPEQRNYDLAFAATDLTTQFDFDYATDLYQPFNGGPYIMPGMGAFIKVGMLDVFEDYKLEGGFRYSFNGNGTEYFISLEDRSKRWDKKYVLQRQALINSSDAFPTQRNYLYQARGILKYPFDEVNAVQFTVTGRYDNLVTLASSDRNLREPDQNFYWLGLKAEYIFDNTLFKALNILNGSRAKVFAEHYRQVLNPETDITIVGVDARNYQRIHRDLIWANRLAASSSIGTRKLVYYMGSVDNWIVLSNRERFDYETNIADDQGYYFQTIATNMRGFIQNARNGNNFAVINSELRWPLVRYLTDKPIKSEFFSNLQVIGFGDVGTAWNGPNPYSDENAFNNIVVNNSSVRVTYKNQNDPIIGGVGWGLRTKVWGYFVRFDYAWGIENGLFLAPITYLSFGLDF